jgi:hypothetical protein
MIVDVYSKTALMSARDSENAKAKAGQMQPDKKGCLRLLCVGHKTDLVHIGCSSIYSTQNVDISGWIFQSHRHQQFFRFVLRHQQLPTKLSPIALQSFR